MFASLGFRFCLPVGHPVVVIVRVFQCAYDPKAVFTAATIGIVSHLARGIVATMHGLRRPIHAMAIVRISAQCNSGRFGRSRCSGTLIKPSHRASIPLKCVQMQSARFTSSGYHGKNEIRKFRRTHTHTHNRIKMYVLRVTLSHFTAERVTQNNKHARRTARNGFGFARNIITQMNGPTRRYYGIEI